MSKLHITLGRRGVTALGFRLAVPLPAAGGVAAMQVRSHSDALSAPNPAVDSMPGMGGALFIEFGGHDSQ